MLVVTSSSPKSPCTAKRPRSPRRRKSLSSSKSSSRCFFSNNSKLCRRDLQLPVQDERSRRCSSSRIPSPCRRRWHSSLFQPDHIAPIPTLRCTHRTCFLANHPTSLPYPHPQSSFLTVMSRYHSVVYTVLIFTLHLDGPLSSNCKTVNLEPRYAGLLRIGK